MQVQGFAPVLDKRQFERKKLLDRNADLLELYASDAAKTVRKYWFSLQDEGVALTRTYTMQFGKAQPLAKVIRSVYPFVAGQSARVARTRRVLQ